MPKKKRMKLGLQDELSEERTLLANERTMLSYIRTSFAAIVGGIAIIGFFREGLARYLGFGVLFFGVMFFVVGILYYFSRKKKIEEEFAKI